MDGVRNADESDVDCGGATCAGCAIGGACAAGRDCGSGVCVGGLCQAPTCTDGVRNGGETDVDCGGATSCPRCADFRSCTDATDCATGACTTGYCGTVGCRSFGTAGGYVGCERDATVPTLPCEDIRTTGTRTGVTDHSSTVVTLPFPFTFYGTAYSSVHVSASGVLAFGTTGVTNTSNACLPQTTYSAFVAAFWEHLHPGGNVYYQTFGTAPNRRFVVQWDATIFGGGATRIDVRAVLHEGSNDVDVCYGNTTSGSTTYDLGRSATSGIQGTSGATPLSYSCNTATLTAGRWLQYVAP
jgi:hypothetical protein